MSEDTIYLFGGSTLDLGRGCLVRTGAPVHLRPQSFEVLKYLVENKGHLISKDQLIEQVWKGRAVTDGSLGKCIEEIREALGADARRYIRNVRGRGYIFDPKADELEGGITVSEPGDAGTFVNDDQESTTLLPGREERHSQRLSAEYASGQIKTSGRGSLLVLGTFVIAIVLAIVAYSTYNGSRSPTISSIAVLPFTNATGDPQMEYLSDGIGENLINDLSQLPQLKVIARSSAFKYKGKEVNPQEVAKALGVQAILTGRVVQRGDDLVVSAELVDTRGETQVWGEQYIRKAVGIQEVQKEIARAISEKLQLRLLGAEEQQQLTKHATENPQAYQLYLNGLFYARKGGFENVRKSLDYYNRATTLDQNFALAWVGIANAYRDLAAKSLLDPKVALARAKAAAQKALELDERLPDAHLALARLKKDEWDWAGAERGYKRAIELNPNLAEAHAKYAQYLSAMGRSTEALAEDKRVQELDPLGVNLGWWSLYTARRYDEAIEKLELAIKLEPDVGVSHGILALTYDAKGMHEQAVNEYQKWISIDGETTSILCYLGHGLAMSRKRSEAQAILNKLKTTKEYVSPGELAVLYIGLGDNEGALAALEKGYEAHDTQLQNLKGDPLYDPLRSDPRFQNLMRRVGLPK